MIGSSGRPDRYLADRLCRIRRGTGWARWFAAGIAFFFVSHACAHPHGAASCEVTILRDAGRVTGAEVALELDDQRSREVLVSMQAALDGSVAPQQEARMAFNLHLLFARLNYLTTVARAGPTGDTAIALAAMRPPRLVRQASGRLKVVASLTRALEQVDPVEAQPAGMAAGAAAIPEEHLRITCADPSWYWLVGFQESRAVQSQGCTATLGPAYAFALPPGLPRSDAPNIEVNASNTPHSQTVEVRCDQ